jgi:hypothetical protein
MSDPRLYGGMPRCWPQPQSPPDGTPTPPDAVIALCLEP